MPGKNIVGGVTSILIDGVRVLVKGPVEYDMGGFELAPVVGSDEIHGLKESPKPARLKFQTTHTSELDLKGLLSKRNVTVFHQLPNGGGIVYSQASVANNGMGNTDEGSYDLEIFALRAEPTT